MRTRFTVVSSRDGWSRLLLLVAFLAASGGMVAGCGAGGATPSSGPATSAGRTTVRASAADEIQVLKDMRYMNDRRWQKAAPLLDVYAPKNTGSTGAWSRPARGRRQAEPYGSTLTLQAPRASPSAAQT